MPGEDLVTRSHGLHVRGVRSERREADFVASTEAIDAYEEIVEQTWDLARFNSNPVVLYAHQSRELPIGVCSRVEVVGGQLECTIRFVTEDKNPKAEQVWKMVRDGELRAVSVGFVPKSYRWEKREGQEVLVFSDNELHEISVVPIPANAEALAKMKAKALAEARTQHKHGASAAKENEMDPKEQIIKLEADVRSGEAKAHNLQKELDVAKATVSALESQNQALATERDAAVAKAAQLEDELISAEVDALVGVKIAPTEKDDFVALRKSNKELFTKFVAQRGDLKLLQPVIASKAAPPVSASDADEIDLTVAATKVA
jgi:HK97 family phage prohead protease